jgi:fructose/tagatose bisphosphate aldolase
MKIPVRDIMRTAFEKGLPVPAFNIPHLPMMEPVVAALRETRTFGLVAVARLEWTKFHAQSPAAVRKEYERVKDEAFTRLHLDHVG